MTIRVCDQGEEMWLDLVVAVTMEVHLFTNDVESGLSDAQVNALDEDDFTEATFTGYAAVEVTSGHWTTTSGDPTSTAYDTAVSFIRSSTGSTETQYGYYVTRAADGKLIYHEYFDSTVDVTDTGDQIDVSLVVTMADTGDS